MPVGLTGNVPLLSCPISRFMILKASNVTLEPKARSAGTQRPAGDRCVVSHPFCMFISVLLIRSFVLRPFGRRRWWKYRRLFPVLFDCLFSRTSERSGVSQCFFDVAEFSIPLESRGGEKNVFWETKSNHLEAYSLLRFIPGKSFDGCNLIIQSPT